MDTVNESKKIIGNANREEKERFYKVMGFGENPNNFSYWFNKVQGKSDFKTPKTIIINLDEAIVVDMYNSDLTEEQIKELDLLIKKQLKEKDFDTEDLFVKGGTYSGKYDFRDCHCSVQENIFERFYRISYDSAMVGAGVPAEVIIREYIPANDKTPVIYNGMPLRNEYRVFVDFDEESVMGIVNYWHETQMCRLANGKTLSEAKKNLLEFKKDSHKFEKWEHDYFKDFETWLNWFESLNREVVENQQKIIMDKIDSLVKSHALKGRWSVDIMVEGDEYYLIDMAIAERSAMYELIEKKDESKG